MIKHGMVLVAVVGSAISLAHADTLVTDATQPWETCAECHSLDGISAMARFPKLAGQRPQYIVKQVRDFRDGRRGNDSGQMTATASDIGDEALAKSAAYFASLSPPPPDASLAADTETWRRGAALYQNGDPASGITQCSACHDGAPAERPDVPLIKAQHAAYLAKELRDWRSGERQNDPSQAMPAIAAKLSDDDISGLAVFLASQPRPRSKADTAQ